MTIGLQGNKCNMVFLLPLCFRYVQHSDGTLIISSVKADDAGVFTCTASTQQQLEQRQLQLKVHSEFNDIETERVLCS